MIMPVDSIVIQRQCSPHLQRSRASLTPPEVLQVDRLCRLITQAVKNDFISVHQGFYPLLSAMKSTVLNKLHGV